MNTYNVSLLFLMLCPGCSSSLHPGCEPELGQGCPDSGTLDSGSQIFGELKMSAVRGQTAKVCGVLTNCGEYSVYLGRSYSILTPEGESYYIDGSAADDSGMDCSADRIQDYVPLEGDQVLTLTWEIDLRGCEVAVVEAEPGEPGNSKWVARICKNHFDCLNRVYTSSGSADGITTFTIGQAQVFVDAAAPESSGDAGVNDMRPVTNDN